MITYEYKCTECGHEFEEARSILSETSFSVCPECDGEALRHFRTVPYVDTYFEGSYKAEASIAGN